VELSQSMFTEADDTIIGGSLGNGLLAVNANINALGGNDKIVAFNVDVPSGIPFIVAKKATFDGGTGINQIESSGSRFAVSDGEDFIDPIGILVIGVLKRFKALIGQGAVGIENDGLIELSAGVGQGAASSAGIVSVDGAGRFHGIVNSGRISLSPKESSSLRITAQSLFRAFDNFGVVKSGSAADLISCSPVFGVGFQNYAKGIIDTGGGSDQIVAPSLVNAGSVTMGLGDDTLLLQGPSESKVQLQVRGAGKFDLGGGSDSLVISGLSRGEIDPADGPVGTVSGGSGVDVVRIAEGGFRFSRLSGSTYRIFDANGFPVTDVSGFESVVSDVTGLTTKIGNGLF
jgi:hypothetical protein